MNTTKAQEMIIYAATAAFTIGIGYEIYTSLRERSNQELIEKHQVAEELFYSPMGSPDKYRNYCLQNSLDTTLLIPKRVQQ